MTRPVRKFVKLMSTPEGQDVFEGFEHEADRVWNTGRRHYSAKTIIEYIRHYTEITLGNSEYKVDNDMAPGLARMYEAKHSTRAGFFEKRKPQAGPDPWDELEFGGP